MFRVFVTIVTRSRRTGNHDVITSMNTLAKETKPVDDQHQNLVAKRNIHKMCIFHMVYRSMILISFVRLVELIRTFQRDAKSHSSVVDRNRIRPLWHSNEMYQCLRPVSEF